MSPYIIDRNYIFNPSILPGVNGLSPPITMPKGSDVVSGVFQDIFSVYFGVLVVFWLIACLR